MLRMHEHNGREVVEWVNADGAVYASEDAENMPGFVLLDGGIIPQCDVCGGPQETVGNDWNGDSGSHYSCQRVGSPHVEDVRNGETWCGICGFISENDGDAVRYWHGDSLDD
jgi:hypothetical protein